MRFEITWDSGGMFAGHRDSPNFPNRVQHIEADSYELVFPRQLGEYPIGVQFTQNGEIVATFFTLPLSVVRLAEVS